MKLLFLMSLVFFVGCSSKPMKVQNPEQLDQLNQNDEFEKVVQIKETKDPETSVATVVAEPIPNQSQKKKKSTLPPPLIKKPLLSQGKKKLKSTPAQREPDLEDTESFVGRRPQVDPFRVGEAVIHDVRYNLLPFSAGKLTLAVDPFVEVNGRKAYSFRTSIETYPNFSRLIYSVDDKAVTLMDFEDMIPQVFTLHVKESGQLKEARSYFDFNQLKAIYWEKKVTKKTGVEERKLEWEILPYSQNVFSAIFYMRTFQWKEGKEYAFRVADDQENLIFKARVVRREKLETDAGDFHTIVVKPEFTVKGIFKPVGDIYIWLSDDERKLVLRIESKIKIGSLVSEVIEIQQGDAP